MTYAEALKVAIEYLRSDAPEQFADSGEPLLEAAAMLERLAPFLVLLDKHARGELNYAPMMDAYRALSTEETTKP